MTASNPTIATVRKATGADTADVSAALASAFYADPLFGWLIPDQSVRADANRRTFDVFVPELLAHDDTWTTHDGAAGAALWVPAGRPPLADERAEQVVGELLSVPGADTDRVIAIFTLLEEHHPAEPHEYLWFLGVIPAEQGRGIGSALLAPVLQRADRNRTPAYLEATSPRNVALYERHGFRASAPISVSGGPPLWPMWREPAQDPGSSPGAPRG